MHDSRIYSVPVNEYKGESNLVKQKDSGYEISARLDSDFRSLHIIPFIDYTSLKREIAEASGTQTITEIGTRIAKSGVLAPFVSIGVSVLNEKQSGDNNCF